MHLTGSHGPNACVQMDRSGPLSVDLGKMLLELAPTYDSEDYEPVFKNVRGLYHSRKEDNELWLIKVCTVVGEACTDTELLHAEQCHLMYYAWMLYLRPFDLLVGSL